MDEIAAKPYPPDLAPYVEYWRRRNAEAAAEIARLEADAQEDARAIAAMLRRDFGATRVILFGSLARGGFHPDSDIDLAVAGLPIKGWFRAYSAANQLARHYRWVELFPLEDLDEHFLRRVLETGVEL
jgi:predicted nucleotidyltransferase